MIGSSQQTTSAVYSAADYARSDYSGSFALSADDRIGVPLKRHRIRAFFARLTILGILGGGAWAAYEYQTVWQKWVADLTPASPSISIGKPAIASTSALPAGEAQNAPSADPAGPKSETERHASAPQKSETAAVAPVGRQVPSLVNKTEEKKAEVAATPASTPSAPASLATTGNVPAASTAYTAPAAPKAPTPAAAENLKRAEVAGLHPELSHVILARLSTADYQNAATAISRAVAHTGDDDALLWPKQRKTGQAQFKVHFVEGAAAPDCRRYVVTIAKDGWLHTALPMEKCGIVRKQQVQAHKADASP